MTYAALIGFIAITLSGCSGGLPFSSGQLQGAVAAAPTDWGDIAQVEIVQLETNPEDPYSVNLWVIAGEQSLYVFAGASRSTWVEHIEGNSAVRLKAGEAIYELTAQRVTDPVEFEAFATAWEKKYGRRPRNENVEETYLLRLRSRDSS